ncbi:hypothetical protein BCR35DRAFT_299147 [Leucosporidium creatinivorum]|uniref:Uncharacterized protein n=1 Tax=Leucosporidium creatinivorum TaxID=106004 RepID=A0A1Y2G349_9BASI|nr:hypothetical protein BCR35DRAFT_299143 [Leucosporidium creatinivorum]ORY91798.1 hypothetical protein BCR35DRAFT_299147 [Leucosporidium creatinivorum]
MKILESLLDYTPKPDTPRPLLVVVTGDAKSSEYNPTGFLGPVRRALDRGWDVEIMSFASGTSSSWTVEEKRASKEEEGGAGVGTRGKLRIVDLEKFAAELVL